MNKGKKYIVLLFLTFLISGCNRTSVEIDSTISEGIASIEEIMALEPVEENSVEIEEDEEITDEWKMESDEEVASAKYRSNGTIEVSIERIENSIKNENGEVIAVVYYEKPVVSGDSEAAKKINAFFESEQQSWFGSHKSRLTRGMDSYYDYFYKGVKISEEQYGTEALVDTPLHYVMETRIKYLDENTLSIFQILDVMLGTRAWSYYGSTFDLSTGELIPITELIEIKPEEMRKILEDGTIGSWFEVEYDELADNNYIITDFDEKVNMRYEYFYDGENFYITENLAEYSGLLIKWNGKWGSEYIIQNIQCMLDWPHSNLTWIEWYKILGDENEKQ